MNRLSPLVRRRAPNPGSFPIAAAMARPVEATDVSKWMDDARLFATGWVAGLVFFGTLFA